MTSAHEEGSEPSSEPGEVHRQLEQARAALAAAKGELGRLRSEVRRLGLFAEQNTGLIVIHDTRGQILDANGWACNVLGYSARELRQKTMMELEVSLRDTEVRFVLQNWEAMKLTAPIAARGRYIRKDGTTFPVDMSIAAFIGDGARRFIVIATDITDRERVEKAVRAGEQRFRFVFEGSPVGMIRLNPRGELIQANRAFLDTLGYSARALRRKPLSDLVCEEDRQLVCDNLVFGDGTAPSARMEVRFTAREGAVVWLQMTVFAEYGPDRELRQAIGVCEDISDRKRAEQRLAELLRTREEEISERTADLRAANLRLREEITERKNTELRLAEALQEAKRANEAKQRFLANISHEIRTPLNAIMGMAELLSETQLDREQREQATTIQTSGAHLLTLINDILDFSKIEARKLQLEARPFELDHCIEAAFDLIAADAAAKRLQLRYSIAPETPLALVGDELRLRQILANLLSNAVKFTRAGMIEVAVEPGAESGELLFRVRDTGVGVPAGAIEHLLGAFTQLDASTTRRYGGTGLGLSISKLLCGLMGGEIWGESEGIEGRGSTFHFRVRCALASAERSHHLRAGVPALCGKRAMLVGSEPVQLAAVAQWLRYWGAAVSGPSAPDEVLGGAVVEETLGVDAAERADVMLVEQPPGEMPVSAQAGRRSGEPAAGSSLARLIEMADARDLPIISVAQVAGQQLGGSVTLAAPFKVRRLYELLIELLGDAPVRLGAETPAAVGAPRPLDILVAEDTPVNRRVVRLLLKRLGYSADVAVDGQEALNAILGRRYDVVLMDLQMPELDGLEVTRLVRASALETQPYIVALTASAMKGERRRCIDGGMNDYLSKPVSRRALQDALVRATASRDVSET